MNRDLTIFCTAIREIKHFIIVIRDFTDSRGRDLAISCAVLREFLYFRAMIREPGIFPNVIHDLKVPWEGLFNLFDHDHLKTTRFQNTTSSCTFWETHFLMTTK